MIRQVLLWRFVLEASFLFARAFEVSPPHAVIFLVVARYPFLFPLFASYSGSFGLLWDNMGSDGKITISNGTGQHSNGK